MVESSPGGEPNDSGLGTASTVLVLSPAVDGVRTCVELLAPGADDELPRRAEAFDRVVVVSVSESLGTWQSQFDGNPSLSGVPIDYVDVRTLVRSTDDGDDGDAPMPAVTVSSPADLGSLGTALNDLLSTHGSERIGLCLYSITDMLQFVDREFLFKFLFTLSKRLGSTNAVAFYHVDTETANEELETLFSHCAEISVSVTDEETTVEPGRYGATSEPP